MTDDRKLQVAREARRLLTPSTLFLDTETTGLKNYAEICEIAITASDGTVLLDTLVRPTRRIPSDATAIHGIGDADVANSPSIGEALEGVLDWDKVQMGIYNSEFDLRMLVQSATASGSRDVLDGVRAVTPRTHCVMKMYAQFYGEPGRYGDYAWQKLSDAALQCGLSWKGAPHRALADTRMTLDLQRYMSAYADGA